MLISGKTDENVNFEVCYLFEHFASFVAFISHISLCCPFFLHSKINLKVYKTNTDLNKITFLTTEEAKETSNEKAKSIQECSGKC